MTLYRDATPEEVDRFYRSVIPQMRLVVPVELDDEFNATPVVTEVGGLLSHVVWMTSKSRGEAMLPPGRYALVRIGGGDAG